MIIFTKKQGETNYNLNNIEYILYNIQFPLIQQLIYDDNAIISVLGDIHKSQIYSW